MRDSFRAVVEVPYRADLTVHSTHERADIDWLLEPPFVHCMAVY